MYARYCKISEISDKFKLVTDSQEVGAVLDAVGVDLGRKIELESSYSLFVLLDASGTDYAAVYAFLGLVPELDKQAFLLFSKQEK